MSALVDSIFSGRATSAMSPSCDGLPHEQGRQTFLRISFRLTLKVNFAGALSSLRPMSEASCTAAAAVVVCASPSWRRSCLRWAELRCATAVLPPTTCEGVKGRGLFTDHCRCEQGGGC